MAQRQICANQGARMYPDGSTGLAELATHAIAAELAAAEANPTAHRDLWIKLALRRGGLITGAEARDLHVIQRLAEGRRDFDTVWRRRDPGDFPD